MKGMSRSKKWAISAFLIHAVAAAALISLELNTSFSYRVEAARALSRLEFAVDPAVRWLLAASSSTLRAVGSSLEVPITTVIAGFSYLAYISLGGLFYGLIAGFCGWIKDRRARATDPTT